MLTTQQTINTPLKLFKENHNTIRLFKQPPKRKHNQQTAQTSKPNQIYNQKQSNWNVTTKH